jgi:putative GTP pyrophosphokinase
VATADQLRKFLTEYQPYVETVVAPAEQEVRRVLRTLRHADTWTDIFPRGPQRAAPTPVYRYRTRIKRPESIVDKVERKPTTYPDGLTSSTITTMYDVLGVRIVAFFLSDLPAIHRWITTQEVLEVYPDEAPVAYMPSDLHRKLGLTGLTQAEKESGYHSLHYIVRLQSSDLDQRPWFELQVRTLLEDAWAEIEHALGYKPQRRTSFAVRDQFSVLSKSLTALDEHFDFVRKELERFQDEVKFNDTDPVNAENLPGILHETGIACPQDRIDSLLKILYSRNVKTIAKFRETATRQNLELISNVYREHEGHEPNHFQMVACLASIRSAETDDEKVARVEAQIEYDRATWDLRRRPQVM